MLRFEPPTSTAGLVKCRRDKNSVGVLTLENGEFWPDLGTDFTASELRQIADELDRLNGVKS